ncbi:hypothetical protein MHYP_G00308250 [Metynnis hypsauchen]
MICLKETWLSAEIPSEATEPAGFSMQPEDRTKDLSGKSKGKPCLNCEVHTALNTRTAAFKSGNTDEYKKASYDLRKTIRPAKHKYRAKVESQFNTTNMRSL